MFNCIKYAEVKGTYVISTSFFFVFTSYFSIQSLQSSFNEEGGLGTASLSTLYATFILSAILAPLGLKIIGCRRVIIIAWVCNMIYTGTNFYPKWWTLLPSSILVGSLGGLLWTAQGVYLTRFSFSLSDRLGTDRNTVLNHLNGIFFSIFQFSGLPGSLIMSTVLVPDTQSMSGVNNTQVCGADNCPMDDVVRKSGGIDMTSLYILLGIFLALQIAGLTITVICLPQVDASCDIVDQPMKVAVLSCVQGLRDTKLLMLTPLMVVVAVSTAVFWADYVKVT